MEHHHIRNAEHLAEALRAHRFLLFKQSFRCPISARAFDEYQAYADSHPAVAHGWIDVVAQRPLSLDVAKDAGVQHESPQALLFEDGKVIWHESHGRITREALELAVTAGTSSA